MVDAPFRLMDRRRLAVVALDEARKLNGELHRRLTQPIHLLAELCLKVREPFRHGVRILSEQPVQHLVSACRPALHRQDFVMVVISRAETRQAGQAALIRFLGRCPHRLLYPLRSSLRVRATADLTSVDRGSEATQAVRHCEIALCFGVLPFRHQPLRHTKALAMSQAVLDVFSWESQE